MTRVRSGSLSACACGVELMNVRVASIRHIALVPFRTCVFVVRCPKLSSSCLRRHSFNRGCREHSLQPRRFRVQYKHHHVPRYRILFVALQPVTCVRSHPDENIFVRDYRMARRLRSCRMNEITDSREADNLPQVH